MTTAAATMSDVLSRLEDAITAVLEANAIERVYDAEPTTYDDAIALCERIERNIQRIKSVADRRYKYLTAQPASVAVMTTFIVNDIAKPEARGGATVKVARDLAGGETARVLRRAEGKCELCGSEWHISVHHIIPRNAGGLSLEDNLIALCNACHNEVEDQGYHSRSEVLQHKRSKVVPLYKPDASADADADLKRSAIAEKAAATRAANAVKDVQETRDLDTWSAQWPYFWKHVPWITAGEVPPTDPEWYAVVYGGARLEDIPRHRR